MSTSNFCLVEPQFDLVDFIAMALGCDQGCFPQEASVALNQMHVGSVDPFRLRSNHSS